jgi:hypothetical protein
MFERRPFSFFVMCGVTFKARAATTKSFPPNFAATEYFTTSD